MKKILILLFLSMTCFARDLLIISQSSENVGVRFVVRHDSVYIAKLKALVKYTFPFQDEFEDNASALHESITDFYQGPLGHFDTEDHFELDKKVFLHHVKAYHRQSSHSDLDLDFFLKALEKDFLVDQKFRELSEEMNEEISSLLIKFVVEYLSKIWKNARVNIDKKCGLNGSLSERQYDCSKLYLDQNLVISNTELRDGNVNFNLAYDKKNNVMMLNHLLYLFVTPF